MLRINSRKSIGIPLATELSLKMLLSIWVMSWFVFSFIWLVVRSFIFLHVSVITIFTFALWGMTMSVIGLPFIHHGLEWRKRFSHFFMVNLPSFKWMMRNLASSGSLNKWVLILSWCASCSFRFYSDFLWASCSPWMIIPGVRRIDFIYDGGKV